MREGISRDQHSWLDCFGRVPVGQLHGPRPYRVRAQRSVPAGTPGIARGWATHAGAAEAAPEAGWCDQGAAEELTARRRHDWGLHRHRLLHLGQPASGRAPGLAAAECRGRPRGGLRRHRPDLGPLTARGSPAHTPLGSPGISAHAPVPLAGQPPETDDARTGHA